ncbi:hypothetical protein H206_03545 [Candidatus Electrothrix aarhusensis]|uniref:Uncharacterized protein n=1 Tax=Candidatus Electrothrix aarhusensis TaxID=1859131 RepID=A0A444IRS9_9BACT|nr:hypothetical protein H206_03545 [Candidatus Electrothrix aarhusensis]
MIYIKKITEILFTVVYLIAACVLIGLSIAIMGFSIHEVFINFNQDSGFISLMLHTVGTIIISAAILDVAQYMIEEEVMMSKELRDPEEARKTITKILVIISIAVGIEGLVYIFKAGTEDLSLLIYPSILIMVSAFLIISLGIYQKLSVGIEQAERERIVVKT